MTQRRRPDPRRRAVAPVHPTCRSQPPTVRATNRIGTHDYVGATTTTVTWTRVRWRSARAGSGHCAGPITNYESRIRIHGVRGRLDRHAAREASLRAGLHATPCHGARRSRLPFRAACGAEGYGAGGRADASARRCEGHYTGPAAHIRGKLRGKTPAVSNRRSHSDHSRSCVCSSLHSDGCCGGAPPPLSLVSHPAPSVRAARASLRARSSYRRA